MARPSHVRDAVRERLRDRSRHGWTIEDLQRDLHRSGVAADYSSVFRAVVWLETHGESQRVDLGDGKARYEAQGAHHDHVQCERCGDVGAIPDCVVESAAAEIERTTGFRVQAHRLVLTGVCPSCRSDAEPGG